jgi:hypothetical protein
MPAHIRTVVLLLLIALVVACSSASTETPALTPESEAELSARGLALLCDEHCIGAVVYVNDHVYETVSPPVLADPLTEVQQTAITRQLANVEFVNEEAANAIHDDAGFVFVVGPVQQQSNGLAQVEVSAVGPTDIFTEIFYFSWDGQDWVAASSGSNVTVSTLD